MEKRRNAFIVFFFGYFVFLFFVAGQSFGCSSELRQQSPRIFTGIPPLLYFVKNLLGKNVFVQSFLSPGSNPVTFEPSFSRLQELRKARLFFLAGLPMERAFELRFKKNFPALRILDLQSHIPVDLLLPDRGHAQTSFHNDPHFWLSPRIMLALLPQIAGELQKVFPKKAAIISKRKKWLSHKIQKLHKALQSQKNLQGRYFVVHHPSWAYFARDYGLHMVSIEEHGVESNPGNLQKVLEIIKAQKIRRIIVQPEFAHFAAKALASELGVKLVFLSPLAENWEETLLCLSQSIQNLDCNKIQ